MDGYDLLFSGISNGFIPVAKYRSKRTGLTVCLAGVEGPLVNGFFCLATEAHDDDGLPHTLEHLIFLGSEEYPYKGILDMMANRCLAQGTNAWTDTDHTCYTVMTAGSEGFLNLLTIYLDHILYPTLTDAAYVTEVHHVNGEGEDAGVVYCEMQARENSGESRCHLNMLRKMYPGHCGYKSETGGIMANLRTSTSNEKVRAYHQAFYRPDNLCLVITGKVDPVEVFQRLQPFEEKIISKGALPQMTKPWTSPVPPLTAPVEEVIPYPSDDESNGLVYVAWRGPQVEDLYEISAISGLLEYLTDTSVSPLQRDFVETSDPFCSNVRNSMIEATECCVYLKFDNVPKAKLGQVKDRLFQTLGNLANGKEAIDMNRMQNVLHRKLLDLLSRTEDRPHDTLAFICIGDFLYGNENNFQDRLEEDERFKKLKTESVSFWINLLKKYFVEGHSVVIIGDPSNKLADDMAKEEKERVRKQQEALGEEGLKMKGHILKDAIEKNEVEPSTDVISKLPIPSTDSILFHNLQRYSNMNSQPGPDRLNIDQILVPFQLDDARTLFVQLKALMDTTNLPANLKMYLPLFTEVIFELPVQKNGVLIPYEEVVHQLASDTLKTKSHLGVFGRRFRCGHFSEVAFLSIKTENEKYTTGVQWLQNILYKTQFTAERLKIVATKMMNEVAKMKRDGRTIALALLTETNFANGSNHSLSGMVKQHAFLTKIVELLDTDPDKVIREMEELRQALTSPSTLRVHVTAQTTNLPEAATDPWRKEFSHLGSGGCKDNVKLPVKASQLLRSNPQHLGQIIGVGSVESSFFVQTVECVDSFSHVDLPAIMVYMECLCALEGPMWKQIRGMGLAYHYRMHVKPEEGLLYLQLFKCTHVVSAYKETKAIVEGYLSGSTPFDQVQVETAKSSVLYEIIEREETVSSASVESLMNYFRETDADYNRALLASVSKVTMEDLYRVGATYFTKLIDDTVSRCAVVCHPSKVDEIKEGFKGLSRDLHVLSSLEEAFSSL
ncbi:hypothetical protein HOLleu_36243 [Holothuria leucospilota]|uniref:Peptidase M16C associated domain-containing protein n=1 Tax=Holothuria leucospilota TaxID=206669 RepID=A0A9Q0YJW5_HOLLE|nr:hypothetical protein HOLleu_36243 [Holothuria leucospilota]